ncbi:unnamed protein product, partial [Ectocarpus sp. 12 AP-2014]
VVVLQHLPVAVARDSAILAAGGWLLALAAARRGRRPRGSRERGVLGVVASRRRLGDAQHLDPAAKVLGVELVEDPGHLLLHVAERVQQGRGDINVEWAARLDHEARAAPRGALGDDVAP